MPAILDTKDKRPTQASQIPGIQVRYMTKPNGGAMVYFDPKSGVVYKPGEREGELGMAAVDNVGKPGGLPEAQVLSVQGAAAGGAKSLLSTSGAAGGAPTVAPKYSDMAMPAASANAKLEAIKKKKALTEDSIEDMENPYEASFTPAQ